MQRILRKDLGSGAATPFNPNIIFVDSDEVLVCPEPDEDGIVINSNVILNPGAQASSFYVTADTLKINSDTVGEIDSEGFEVKAEGTMPGDNLTSKKLANFALKRNFLVFFQTCKGGEYEMMGSCCNPIRLSFGTEKDKDKTITKVMMKRPINTDDGVKIYKGSLSFAEPFVVADATAVALSPENGAQYNLPESNSATSVAIDTNTLTHGDVVSFVGNGGTAPATLANGFNVMLKSGSTWEALDGATISLKVFDDGTNLILVEQTRTA